MTEVHVDNVVILDFGPLADKPVTVLQCDRNLMRLPPHGAISTEDGLELTPVWMSELPFNSIAVNGRHELTGQTIFFGDKAEAGG